MSIFADTKYARVFTPEEFGAIGGMNPNPNQANADTLGWNNAIKAALDVRGIVRATGMYYVNDTLQWNVLVPVEGRHVINSLIMDPNKYLIRTVSTDPADVASPIRQRAISWHGGIFWGNGMSKGLDISGTGPWNSRDKPAHISFEHCVVKNFTDGVYFGMHAYMVAFKSCNIQGNTLGIKHDGATNSGERLEFIGCDITGNVKAIELTSGQSFHFQNCSFSYNTGQLGSTSNGSLYFVNCHMEFDAPGQSYFDITADGGAAYFTLCRWLIGAKDGRVEYPIFNLVTERTKVVLDGGHMGGSAVLDYISNGPGSMLMTNTQTFNFGEFQAHLNDVNQAISDPGFVKTSIFDDWKLTNGNGDTMVIATDEFHSGTQALKITHAVKASGSTIDLFIPVSPGDRLLTEFWHKLNNASSAFAISWHWATSSKVLDAAMVTSSRYGSTGLTWQNLKQPHTLYKSAPAWAAYLVVRFNVASIESGATLHLYDFKVSRF